MRRPATVSLTLIMLLVTFAAPAQAYLDPGTGSMILQGLIAGIAMISLTIKMWWYKFTSLFRKNKPAESLLDDEPSDDQDNTRPEQS